MIYVLIVFVLSFASCKKTVDNVSAERFGGVEHALSKIFPDFKRVEFLTKHVHNNNWRIVYGFGCNSSPCSNSTIPYKDKDLLTYSEKKKHEIIASRVENKISWALDTWLAALRKLDLNEKIITKEQFEFIELPPELDMLPLSDGSDPPFIYTTEQLRTVDLLGKINLMVIVGNNFSYAYPKRSRELFLEPLSIPPLIYIRHDVSIEGVPSKTGWEHTILHELGHAFGLIDTYPNDANNLDTRGQSAAVMNFALQRYQSTPSLAPDDIKGMEWLYNFYHDRQKLKKNECLFADYEIVASNSGEKICRPIYPVTHEIKQAYLKEHHGNLAEATAFMNSAIRISDNFKNKKERSGRTALHYAVIHESRSIKMKVNWRQTIKDLVKSGFDKKIADIAGNTACDYFQCEDNTSGIRAELQCSKIKKLLC